ncbi:MAG: hypothetical protein IBX52_00620 [Bacterioplanes sp.]|nr:hypothetical protein [Bacterioplanes sp.]
MKYLVWLMVLFMSGCLNNTLKDTPDRELRQRHYQCRMAVNLSAAEIQVCQNVSRECDRRARKGHFAC